MALPPTIPTSFVPKQPVAPATRRRTSGINPFLALSYLILGLSIFGSASVFAYQYYLDGVAKKKSSELVTAQNGIDQATVQQFIRLRDRFTSSKEIIDHHVALSQFLDELESMTLQSVRFSSLSLDVDENRTAHIDLVGVARNFNALAAQSSTIAGEKRIKRAIFSGIAPDPKDGTVKFALKADIDPALVVLGAPAGTTVTATPEPLPLPQPPATTTQTTAATTTKQ